MVYSPALNKCIITPQKCGTHTIIRAIGDGIFTGHIPYEDHVDLLIREGIECREYAMNIRDPIDRFISVINHLYAYSPDPLGGKYTLDKVFRRLKRPPAPFFPSQSSFYHPNVRLFPFEDMSILGWLGFNGEAPKENIGKYEWSKEEIMDHRIFEWGMEQYKEDFKLREMLNV